MEGFYVMGTEQVSLVWWLQLPFFEVKKSVFKSKHRIEKAINVVTERVQVTSEHIDRNSRKCSRDQIIVGMLPSAASGVGRAQTNSNKEQKARLLLIHFRLFSPLIQA